MSPSVDDAFVEPDWESPIDLGGYLAQVPSESKVKGLLFRTALREAKARAGRTPTDQPYRALADYPLTEFVQVLVECARLAHPEVTAAEGMRRLGRCVFPGLKENPAGIFLFSLAGNSLGSALKLVSKAYSAFASKGARVSVAELQEGRAVIQIRRSWSFPQFYHVGIFEGAMGSFKVAGDVTVQILTPCDVDLQLRWQQDAEGQA